MSDSKRYAPPIGCPLGRKLDSMGVGRTGTAGEGILRTLGSDDILLTEVFGEVSWSALAVRLLLLRLEDEKFFRRPVAGLIGKRAGEFGIDVARVSLSAEVTLVNAEAVEEMGSPASEPVSGNEAFLPRGMLTELGGSSLMIGLGGDFIDDSVPSADWGASGIGSCGMIDDGTGGGCVFGA